MDYDEERQLLLTVSRDNIMKIWNIENILQENNIFIYYLSYESEWCEKKGGRVCIDHSLIKMKHCINSRIS